jgi:hypothetical protein
LLAHLASDLATLIPGIGQYNLCMPGAVYDQTQLLQPGYPVFAALESLVPQAEGGTQDLSQLVALGAVNGKMPVVELQPGPNIPPGILQLLPVLVSGPAGEAAALADSMEHLFLDQGQVSAHTARNLEAAFGISSNHARFMTLTDLNAMLHLQLEHFGFLPLWELLDAALEDRAENLDLSGAEGQQFRWAGGMVHGRFETFDFWASNGSGRDVPGDPTALTEAYIDWTRGYRQYLVTLEAHGVPVHQHLPGGEDQDLDGSFFIEESAGRAGEDIARVTEHTHAELGVVAVTVAEAGRLLNYYPIRAQGLNALHAHVREAGFAADGIAFPGGICCDAETRRLAADRLP